MKKKRIVLFASGSGSNVENIFNYFKGNHEIEIVHLFCNKPDAYALERAKNLGLPFFLFTREEFYNSEVVITKLKELEVDFIVLAGFLWLIPPSLINNYRTKIVNIHPALLPKYGGIGMYGMNVHKAVVKNKDSESGITIHHVNEKYDEGNIVFQTSIPVFPEDTAEDVSVKVQALEYLYFPRVIEEIILGSNMK